MMHSKLKMYLEYNEYQNAEIVFELSCALWHRQLLLTARKKAVGEEVGSSELNIKTVRYKRHSLLWKGK